MSDTAIVVTLFVAALWGLFTAYVLVDGWLHLRRATAAMERTAKQLDSHAHALSEINANNRRTALLAQAEYASKRGLPEPETDKIRQAFAGF